MYVNQAGDQISPDLLGSSKGFMLRKGLPHMSNKLAEKSEKEFLESYEILL